MSRQILSVAELVAQYFEPSQVNSKPRHFHERSLIMLMVVVLHRLLNMKLMHCCNSMQRWFSVAMEAVRPEIPLTECYKYHPRCRRLSDDADHLTN